MPSPLSASALTTRRLTHRQEEKDLVQINKSCTHAYKPSDVSLDSARKIQGNIISTHFPVPGEVGEPAQLSAEVERMSLSSVDE